MKKTIYQFNSLLRMYNKYRRKLANLNKTNKNERRQHILQKHIARLHEKLTILNTTLRLSTAAASVVAGTFAFVQTANAQVGFAPKQINPFNISNSGNQSTPTFADIDGDGDLDMLTGDYYYAYLGYNNYLYENRFKYYENIGTAANPIFASPVINPFGIFGNNNNSDSRFSPTFVDIDGDGDMDIVYGDRNGNFNYLENTGSPTAPSFAASVSNPFNLASVGYYQNSVPAFIDIDGDGDFDLITGTSYGDFVYFENTGSSLAPSFATPVSNPFNLTSVGYYENSAPAFIDIDGDGDFDLLSGHDDGDFYYYENTGSSSVPNFAASQMNPFNLTFAGQYYYSGSSRPTFADLDGDGDMDLMAGDRYGDFTYFRQCAASTASLTVTTACGYNAPSGQYFTTSGTFMDIIPNVDGCDSIITINLTINPILDQSVTPLNPVLCGSGTTTIDVGASQDGVSYYLRNDSDNSIIAGPIVGNGTGISLNTGTISATTTYNVYAEKVVPSTGLQFEGNNVDNMEVNCGNASSVQLSGNQITLEAWIYPTDWRPNVWQGSVINKEGSGDLGYMLRCGNNGRLNFNLGNGSWNEITSPQNTLTLNSWQHVAGTYDGTTMSLYVGGNLVASQSMSISYSSPTADLTVGNWSNGGGRAFIGNIDEVRVWSVSKTETELQANMNSCLSGTETGLAAYYQFEDGTGSTTVSDITPNGNNGTLQNMDENAAWALGTSICSTCNLDLTQTATVTIVPVLVGTNNTTICNNESIVINGTTYNASNSTGTEVFTNVGVNGCDSTVTISLNVLPALNTTTSVANETITASLSGATYQWLDCDNSNASISGATGQSFTATANGSYAVEITNNGCTETSSCVSVLSVGVMENNALSAISIYPNPSTGMFTVSTNQLGKNYTITDNLGKVVTQGIINNSQTDIDLSNSSNGIYLLTIEGHVFKLVKQ